MRITKEEKQARARIEEIFAARGIQKISNEEYQHLLSLCGPLAKRSYLLKRKIRWKTGLVGDLCDQCFSGKTGRCSCPYHSRDEYCERCWE
jgi:hypothetical protein